MKPPEENCGISHNFLFKIRLQMTYVSHFDVRLVISTCAKNYLRFEGGGMVRFSEKFSQNRRGGWLAQIPLIKLVVLLFGVFFSRFYRKS